MLQMANKGDMLGLERGHLCPVLCCLQMMSGPCQLQQQAYNKRRVPCKTSASSGLIGKLSLLQAAAQNQHNSCYQQLNISLCFLLYLLYVTSHTHVLRQDRQTERQTGLAPDSILGTLTLSY